MAMWEDLFYELLPVVGFSVVVSSIFILIVMKGVRRAYCFVLFLATADLFLGITLIIAGFHGVLTTIYGRTGETVKPLTCALTKAIHLPMEVFSDALHSLVILWMAGDRLLQMLIPVQYDKVQKVYTNWLVFSLVVIVSGVAVIPSFDYPLHSRTNISAVVSPLCRFEQVFGEEYFSDHLWAVQWAPLLGLALLGMSLVVFGIRNTKQRWIYNWSESSGDTLQLSAMCLIRCLMSAIAIHLPLLLIQSYPTDAELTLLIDPLIRISFSLCLPILQPIYYLLTMPVFIHRLRLLFNKYSHNTKRTWQSAGDPPKTGVEVESNPFGSWYSSALNGIGDPGLATEERAGVERSISFYYREDGPKRGSISSLHAHKPGDKTNS